MNFNLNLGNWNSIFAIPTCVVDKHLKLSGGAQLKVLLWILRYAGTEFSIDNIASSLSMHIADVKDSIQYWVETGVISVNETSIVPNNSISDNSDINAQETSLKSNQTTNTEKPKRIISRPQKPDSVFVATRINGSPEIASLMQEAQLILGRPISNGDCATLLMIHDNDGLPVDVIIMLLQYAVGIGKSNMKYIEKLAIDWASEEIDCLEKAENKIRQLNESKQAWFKIEKIFGITHRTPTAKESELSTKWINQFCITDDLLIEAYERCINNISKIDLRYIDKIITAWHKNGVKTLQQALDENLSSKNKRTKGDHYSPSYNLEEYEKLSIFD